jgi:hypothetical protein
MESVRQLLDKLFNHIDTAAPAARIKETPQLAKELELLIQQHLLSTQRELSERIYEQLNFHTAQLAKIQHAVTVNRQSIDPAAAFHTKLRQKAGGAETLVLVDPYALARKTSAVDAIAELSAGRPLHLYCRADSVNQTEWRKLAKAVGHLSVYLGDFHERYLLAGSKEGPGWKGRKQWEGAVLGRSLHGDGKRPAYVLALAPNEVEDVVVYLDHAAPTPITLKDFKLKISAGR